MEKREPLLEIKDLEVEFHLRQGLVKALNGISYEIPRGKVLGLVGESGSGKSVSARSIMRIEAPGKLVAGEINFNQPGEKIGIHTLPPGGQKIRSLRWNEISMIFQEPMTSFGPMHTLGNQIAEAISMHARVGRKEARERAKKALESVGMPRPDKMLDQYPHQISGGMRQRAMIAMALSCNPSLLIADEPTSALDVSTEAQILDLLDEKQKELNTSILYITHNMEVVSSFADEVIVMYLGNIVEQAPAGELFSNPRHPYTTDLLESIPKITQKYNGKRLKELTGNVPDPYNHPGGCNYHPRCSKAIKGLCDKKVPVVTQISPQTKVACHLYSESDQKKMHDGETG